MNLVRSYSNLPLVAKLGSGFALLILMSMLIAGIGLFALDMFSQRSTVVSMVSNMESSLLESRNAEKNFLLRNDQQYLETARNQANSASQQVQSLRDLLVVPAGLERLDTIESSVTDYQAQLGELQLAVQDRQTAAKSVQSDATALEGALQSRFQFRKVTDAFKAMRSAAQDYASTNADGAINAFETASSKAADQIAGLQVDEQSRKTLSDPFEAYVSSFESLVSATRATHDIEDRIVSSARTALETAVELREIQMGKLERDRGMAVTQIVATTIGVLVAAVLIAWVLTRNIVGPVRQAVDVTSRVASGDLRVEVDSGRTDELGQLLAALGTMVTSLRDLVRRIDTSATSIASSSEEMSTITQQTSEGVNQQKDQTDQVATAMNQMVSTVNDVARSAEEAFNAANEASEKSGSGEKAVEETVSYIADLNRQAETTMERLQGLQSDTENISTVLDVIKSVADQTNLLALNAAIEAARAGEHGRGFSVVAEEVRSLAQRTQSSTSEIETLIENLVASAGESVTTMEAGTKLANQTLDSARSTGETIREMAGAVENIQQYNSQIATAAEQQTSVAEDINRNITQIRDVSDQSAASANQVSSASDELARLGEDLREQVSRFRV
ncbi:methyl-accepting chemotaxis protein [Tamilnaduibacter salinus]|uniref:Methyl-accepting chemotaxis protein n=1 Tax=Tamilnaduibacter salinus TaxID=1484056 RepID=A0A2U1CX23_9GAMM|nr:methyl-accepting chemotaxis protein [Tamilnaduibacter salinus]PVY76790.1 methyl-accepting chemotaxis protein [Tamilnaduibacter salinus]